MPFTADQFFAAFAAYNRTVWPAQIGLLLIAALTVTLAIRVRNSGRLISLTLAVLWLWTAAMYHIAFFATVTPAAYVFAAACIIEAVLLAWCGIPAPRLRFPTSAPAARVAGLALVAYALVGYPIVGVALGHAPPAAPTFGVPCPTTIFTFGILLLAEAPVPLALVVIPTLWAAIATMTAVNFGVLEDLGLPIAAATTLVFLIPRHRPLRV